MGSKMTKIYRDASGKCINIGEWDLKIDFTLPDGERITNPIPEGAYEDQAEVVTGWDGGLYLADNPQAN
jgi:hypothetical protein